LLGYLFFFKIQAGSFRGISESNMELLALGVISMDCRAGCGACCTALSISSAIPGMPAGKPAGVRCIQLDNENKCLLYRSPKRPAVCLGLKPSADMCGRNYEEAMANLKFLEEATRPDNSSF
jgi:hypothetical protein